jgi:hypothetical protein
MWADGHHALASLFGFLGRFQTELPPTPFIPIHPLGPAHHGAILLRYTAYMDKTSDISTPKNKPWSGTVTTKTLALQYGVGRHVVRRAGGAKRILAIKDESARRILLGIKG